MPTVTFDDTAATPPAFFADVQVRDLAFGERDDPHAIECQALEQAGSVFLIAAESIERFCDDRVELTYHSRARHPD